jgi:hypothetical protein
MNFQFELCPIDEYFVPFPLSLIFDFMGIFFFYLLEGKKFDPKLCAILTLQMAYGDGDGDHKWEMFRPNFAPPNFAPHQKLICFISNENVNP